MTEEKTKYNSRSRKAQKHKAEKQGKQRSRKAKKQGKQRAEKQRSRRAKKQKSGEFGTQQKIQN